MLFGSLLVVLDFRVSMYIHCAKLFFLKVVWDIVHYVRFILSSSGTASMGFTYSRNATNV